MNAVCFPESEPAEGGPHRARHQGLGVQNSSGAGARACVVLAQRVQPQGDPRCSLVVLGLLGLAPAAAHPGCGVRRSPRALQLVAALRWEGRCSRLRKAALGTAHPGFALL